MTGYQFVLAIIALLAGVSTGAIGAWAGRKKLAGEVDALKRQTVAKVESIEVETAGRVVKLVSDQLDALTATGVVNTAELERLRNKVDDLERRLNESDKGRRALADQVERLHAHIDALEALMRAGGIDPPPRPRHLGDIT